LLRAFCGFSKDGSPGSIAHPDELTLAPLWSGFSLTPVKGRAGGERQNDTSKRKQVCDEYHCSRFLLRGSDHQAHIPHFHPDGL